MCSTRMQEDWTVANVIDQEALAHEAVCHLQALLRCKTTESETAAIAYLREQLASEGIEARVIEPVAGRPSLWACLPRDGTKRPLLLLSMWMWSRLSASSGAWTHLAARFATAIPTAEVLLT